MYLHLSKTSTEKDTGPSLRNNGRKGTKKGTLLSKRQDYGINKYAVSRLFRKLCFLMTIVSSRYVIQLSVVPVVYISLCTDSRERGRKLDLLKFPLTDSRKQELKVQKFYLHYVLMSLKSYTVLVDLSNLVTWSFSVSVCGPED